MKIETLWQIETQAIYKKAVDFIYKLLIDKNLEWRIKIRYININDFHSNLYPSVYIHNKYNPLKVKKYRRFSDYDLRNAIKFHNSKNIKRQKTTSMYAY